tara:strand:+ start:633 stop:1511 length:879 start_codon:yes stop_codon:yes gene_type:complete
MKILVTGATGFIGQKWVQSFPDKENLVLLVRDAQKLNLDFIKTCQIVEMDSSDQWLAEIFSLEIKGCVHLASLFLSSHNRNQANELVSSNIQFPTQVMETLHSQLDWWLNMGTFWQHYQNQNYSPVNLYAATKQSFQDITQFYSEAKGLNVMHLKISDTYGSGDTRKKIFALWKDQLTSNEPLAMSAGEQEINILHVDDVVNGIHRSIDWLSQLQRGQGINKSFALSSNEVLSLKDLARAFESAAGQPLNIEWGGRPYRDREVMQTWRNFEPLPGWSPTIPLEKGIPQFLNE